MNEGTLSVPPSFAANATCGFTNGLVPPSAGCMWHPPQLSRFILGPRPSSTSSAEAKSVAPEAKNRAWFGLNPASCPPASELPPRTPGSLALKVDPPPPHCEEAISIWKKNKAATDPAKDSGTTTCFLSFIIVSSSASNMSTARMRAGQRERVLCSSESDFEETRTQQACPRLPLFTE